MMAEAHQGLRWRRLRLRVDVIDSVSLSRGPSHRTADVRSVTVVLQVQRSSG